MMESRNKRLRNRRHLLWNSRYLSRQANRTPDSGSRESFIFTQIASDAARSLRRMMIRRIQFVVFATVLIALSSGAAGGAVLGSSSGSVSGLVSDSAGVPQIGAEVQLLRPNLTVIASVYTNSNGRYLISSVVPGRYAVKAMGAWFLPSLRENLRIRTGTVVNLTLNTLYEAMQWLPAEPRTGNAQQEDWAWTLRSAANRPLLRWLENGPLVVASDSTGEHPRLKARLVATGQEGAFSESGERISAQLQDTPSDSRELLAHVDFAPNTDAGLEAMLGFRQDLGLAGSVQSVAAVATHPEVEAAGSDGLDEAAIRSWETIHLGDRIEIEAGADGVLARLSGPSPDTVATLLPFASLGGGRGNSSIHYRMRTFLPAALDSEKTDVQTVLPGLSAQNGALAIQHGMHQEISWERRTDLSGVAVLVFNDRIDNPVLEAHGGSTPSMALLDTRSGLLHAAGPNFSTTGVAASFERELPHRNHLSFDYANGNALVITATPASLPQPASLAQLLAEAHPHRTQTYTLSLSGTLDGTGTRWRASYRWQPDDTVTLVAPFTVNPACPYLSLHLRQAIHLLQLHNNGDGFEAMLDLRNLLAEGYRPYLLSDGSLLIFAQQQRSFRAGLAFNF
jgi:hypothetical protein